MWTALLTFGVSAISAVLPVVNLEVYLIALSGKASAIDCVIWGIAAGAGQTVGKVVIYYLARAAVESPWLQKKLKDGKSQQTLERWSAKIAARPVGGLLVVLVSAFSGFPPLLVIAVVAGTVRQNIVGFVTVVLIGRAARFGLLLYLGESVWEQLNLF